MKTNYETPTVADLGSFEEITQGARVGRRLDASFPVGTPDESLTFS